MNNTTVRTLTFGAVGWNDHRLVEEVYPHDVPAAWRLPCYTSHFDTVLVPEADWRGCTADDVAGWLADLPSQFWFYLLVEQEPDGPRLELLPSLCAVLEDRLGGVVLLSAAADARGALSGRLGGCPVFSASDGTGVQRLWTGAGSPCPCGHVGFVEFHETPSPRVLRITIEAFLACNDEPWSVLFMRAPPATFDHARVIGQLLGVT